MRSSRRRRPPTSNRPWPRPPPCRRSSRKRANRNRWCLRCGSTRDTRLQGPQWRHRSLRSPNRWPAREAGANNSRERRVADLFMPYLDNGPCAWPEHRGRGQIDAPFRQVAVPRPCMVVPLMGQCRCCLSPGRTRNGGRGWRTRCAPGRDEGQLRLAARRSVRQPSSLRPAPRESTQRLPMAARPGGGGTVGGGRGG
jgi:hypothetical protein